MARNITNNEWQTLNILTCNRCNLKTSDISLLQAHHCKPRKQQITADVSYNLVNAKFTCSLCTVELPETEFSEHLEGHLTLKPYVCKYCDRDFSTRGEVCEHLRSFHQQDKQTFMLKLSNRTNDIIQKVKNIGKVFHKPVNVVVPISNSAAVIISKTTAQNFTTAAGQKQGTMKAPVASCSYLSRLRPTSTVYSTLPTAISPVSLGAHPHLASLLNSNTVLTSARLQLPAEQRRYSLVLTTQPQTGFVPTSTNVLQTQAPSCLSQNVCTPASDTSWRHPFAQKLPAWIVVPIKNLPIQGFNAQRGDIQRPSTTLLNLVAHSLHSAVPIVAQNVNTRGNNIVTNVSTTSVNWVKNAPALTVPPVFNLNQTCLSSPSIENTSSNQMVSTSKPSLVNNIFASSTVTSNTHKAGNHLVPTISSSPINQPLALAVLASTEGNSPLMSADMSVNCQCPTETDAGNHYKVSIQQFHTEVKSSVERDNVNGDFAGKGSLQINQEPSSLATEVKVQHSSASAIKSEESTDTPLQFRIENIMSLAACQGDFQQCVQDNTTDTVASTESTLTEIESNTTNHLFNTVQSSNFSFLLVVKECFLCLVCQTKWNADYDSFFKHIWEKHTHEADFSCCPTGYSPYCAHLQAIVKTIYDKSPEPMSDQIRSYFTPKSSIKTEIENVQTISSSESSSSAPVPSMVETVKHVNVSESPPSTVSLRPSSAPRECEQILPADSVSRSSESSPLMGLVPDQHRHMIETEQNYDADALTAGNELENGAQYVQESAIQIGKQGAERENICTASELPTTLVPDQRRHMIETEQNYDFGALTVGNELEKGVHDVEESAIQIGKQRADENICSASQLRDLNFNDEVLQNITAIDLSSSVNEERKNKNTYEDDDHGVINYHNCGTGSINYSLADSPYSDELPLDLSKKTTQPEKSHNSLTVTPLLAAEMATLNSVTYLERRTPERIDNSHNSFIITPLSVAGTAGASSVTQTEGLLPERIAANPRTRTERQSTESIGMGDDDDISLRCFYGCGICVISFPTAVELKVHVERVHTLEQNLPCAHCGFICRSSNHLIQHMEDHLASDYRKTFSCSLLENSDKVAQFENNDMKFIIRMLKTSLVANSDADAVYHFACNMCQSEFADLDQLGLHLQESLLKVIECKHCASFFLNTFSWQKHMAIEHVDLPRMYCIKRKLLCYERKMHSNILQQASQEDIPCLSNVERDAETSDYQCEGTHHESHGTSEAAANVLDEIETIASNVIDKPEVRGKDVELTETHSDHEGRDVADGIEAQTTHEHISKIPNLLDLVKTSAAMRSWISAVSLNAGKVEQGAVAITHPLLMNSDGIGTYTTTVDERGGSVDVDLHGLMKPVSSHGNNELREIAPDLTAAASVSGNGGLLQIENSGNMEDVQPVSKTSTSVDSSNSVKSAEDNLTNTLLNSDDLGHQGVVAEIPLGVQSSSHDSFDQIVSENISTLPNNITIPQNNHCLNEKAELSVVGQAEAVSEISKPRVKHASHSVVGNIDASSDLNQATSVESQDGCDVTSISTSNIVSCKLPQASDCSVGSKDYVNITSTDLSLPVTRVSDFASTSAAGFNLVMAETSTILCVSEQNELEYTENTCLPIENIGADIDNRQESRHPSLVLENNLRSGVQHDTEHVISNVVKDGGDQAASAAVNGKSISQTVFLASHTSTVGRNSIKEHQQTDVLPSCNIHQADEAARTDSVVFVPSVTDESILSLQLENRQKPTKRSVIQQIVRGASVIHQNFESTHDSETKINDLCKEPCTDNRSHYTPDVISVLKTVSHDSGDIANPATNIFGPSHDSCHDIDFSSSKDPACTLQESVGDFVGNYDILESDISCGHVLLHLYIDRTSSNLLQDTQAEKKETKKDGSYDEIHYNKNSFASTKDGQLYASNETSTCIESRETHEQNVLNSPSHSDNFMEENNTAASVDQTLIASNVTENKDSSHTETDGLSDKVSTEQDLSNSLFRCNCGTLISCFTDGDHNVKPHDKSLKISFTGKCAKCRLVTEESSHPVNTTEHVNSKTVDAEPSEDSRSLWKIKYLLGGLKEKISEINGKIGPLEHVCSYHITRSKVDPPESSTIKPDVLSGHSKTCVGPEISKTNPALKSDLETAADNGSIVLSESKNTAHDFTTSNREMLDAQSKRELEAGQGEGIITSRQLNINSKKHNKPEDTIKKLDRAVAVSQSPKDIQGADVAVPDSARFRCSACPFVTSQSYTELKQHVKSRHPQDKSASVFRIHSISLQNAEEQSERWLDATLALQEIQNNDVTMACVKDGITTPQHTGIHSETSIGYRATVNKSEVNSESSHKINKEMDIGIYRCIRPKCTPTYKWNLEQMKAHIKSKHPYYSCGYCKAPYTTLARLYKHIQFLHRSKKLRVMEGTTALVLLFKRVNIPYNGQGAECTDVTSQTPAKRKKRSQSSIINDGKKFEANASSELKVLKMKGHTPLKSCDVNVSSSQHNQPHGDSKTERTLKDNDDSHSAAAQGLKMLQCKLIHSKSESILEQEDISPMPEHEVSSAEKPTVTSKTATISNNGDSLSAKTENNLLKPTMSSKFAKTFDHTHRIPPTVSLHTKKTVASKSTLLLSPRSAENNTRRNKVTENQESDRHSSAQNVCSKIRSLGTVSSQNTVRKDNSSAATSNHIDINVSLNSATSVQPSYTVKKQELNSLDISDEQELSNRLGNVHETLPEICSETASCESDTVLLPHTPTVASAIVTSKTQDQKHCGTLAASQLEAKTTAEGNENKNFVPEDMRTAHSENNQSMKHVSKTDSKFGNAPTTDMMSFSQHDYPFRCTACGRILKCVRDIEKHYNSDHPREDVQLTERKSGFVYSNSGKCLQWKDEVKAPTVSYLCSYCEFRSMKRSDVEEHIWRAHPTHEVRVFTLCKPSTHRYSTRSKVTALPHEASSSNSPTPSYLCNVCSDVKNSEFQFRLHLASHPCFKHTTQLTAGASFLCHTCGYIAESRSDFAQHTRKHISERRFKCFMCEHDSHNKKSMRARIKSVHNKTVDDDVGIIDRNKQRNVDLRPRLVNIEPQVVLIDPFRQQPNYLLRLLLADGIKTLDLTGSNYPDILTSEQNVYAK